MRGRGATSFSSKEPFAKKMTSGQVFWLSDRTTDCTFPRHPVPTVVCCSVRPRLQRRDRNGFAPFSLFFSRTPSYERHPGPCGTSGKQRPPTCGVHPTNADSVVNAAPKPDQPGGRGHRTSDARRSCKTFTQRNWGRSESSVPSHQRCRNSRAYLMTGRQWRCMRQHRRSRCSARIAPQKQPAYRKRQQRKHDPSQQMPGR